MRYDIRLLLHGISSIYGLLALVFLPAIVLAGDKTGQLEAPGFSNPKVLAPVSKR